MLLQIYVVVNNVGILIVYMIIISEYFDSKFSVNLKVEFFLSLFFFMLIRNLIWDFCMM
uniref:Uncharacterized protein n=1 Tax=Kalanchoe fedtschenkoi TaxID=63787 RepID=A0A7N1A097_KALFE